MGEASRSLRSCGITLGKRNQPFAFGLHRLPPGLSRLEAQLTGYHMKTKEEIAADDSLKASHQPRSAVRKGRRSRSIVFPLGQAQRKTPLLYIEEVRADAPGRPVRFVIGVRLKFESSDIPCVWRALSSVNIQLRDWIIACRGIEKRAGVRRLPSPIF